MREEVPLIGAPVHEITELQDELPLADLVDFAFEAGVDRIHLRAGSFPLLTWHGGVRQIRTRTLTAEDTEAIAATLLDWAHVPERVAQAGGEGASSLAFLCEAPCEGLLQVAVQREAEALSLAIDVIRPTDPL